MNFVSEMDQWFDGYYRKYRERLMGVAENMVWSRDLAEDFVQATFLTMLLQYKKVRNYENIWGWLVITLNNKVMSDHQKAYHSQEFQMPPEFNPGALDEYFAEFKDILPEGLTDAERETLYLYIEAGYQHKEVAEKLGCSPGVYQMRFTRAKEKCRALLENDKVLQKISKKCCTHKRSSNIESRRCKDV